MAIKMFSHHEINLELLGARSVILILALKFHSAFPPLLRLAPVGPSGLLLVSGHASTELNIDARWIGEAERPCYFDQVELIDIEH